MDPDDTTQPMSGRPLVVGLTGGIGSGKSATSELFRALGVPVIDADEIAHALVAPGEPALAAIAEAFGGEVLDAGGALDRGALRRRVFADSSERQRLEAILHPQIRKKIQKEINHIQTPYCILVIPLLLETQQSDLVDRVLVIDAPEDTRVSRVAARDQLPREEIMAVIRTQASRDARLAAADDVIDNTGTLDMLQALVRAQHLKYLQIAAGKFDH